MDTMSLETIPVSLALAFNIAMALIAALGGWVAKGIRDDIRDLKEEDKRLREAAAADRLKVAEEYVRKRDQEKRDDALFETLRRIEDKLDKKVDKE